ncbi:MAG TPA: hypothetical protein VGR13_07955, partial [Actinomycetota bacterium]|nr:hypothetical protein [Actinomycetota bacterium]
MFRLPPMQRGEARYIDVAFGWRIVDGIVALRRRMALLRLRPAFPYLLLLPGLALVSVLAVGVIDLFWKSIHGFDPFLREQGPLSLAQYRRLLAGADGGYYRGILGRTLLVSGL